MKKNIHSLKRLHLHTKLNKISFYTYHEQSVYIPVRETRICNVEARRFDLQPGVRILLLP